MKHDWVRVQELLDQGYSYRQLEEECGISLTATKNAKKKGWITTRSRDESLKFRRAAGLTSPRIQPDEVRSKISSGMKKAHEDGRAWNIGMSRWNNKPSWPEEFFMQVVENEFIDKCYTREYPVGKYSLDFAWVHLNKCIEIDGEQHSRFEDYRLRDQEKDRFLNDLRWSILRIEWKEMFRDTKYWIAVARAFIHENV